MDRPRLAERLAPALAAHGGLELWQRLGRVEARFLRLDGILPAVKGIGRTFPMPGLVHAYPRAGRVEFLDYPEQGRAGVYDRGHVSIHSLDDLPLPGQRGPSHRARLAGFRKHRRWDPLDALYFFGYAITTYFGVPFILLEHATRATPWRGGLRIAASFPASFDTHGRQQAFYFGEDGLLVRHDYRAEVVSHAASGAHFSSDYRRIDGLPIATRRRVFARLGRWATPVPVLAADLEQLGITLEP